jgi:RHS repeat-associated protein
VRLVKRGPAHRVDAPFDKEVAMSLVGCWMRVCGVVLALWCLALDAQARKVPRPGGPQVPQVIGDAISDRVGATPGAFRVDESGAATYVMPLQGAPGAGGLAPVMTLAYSSHAGDGPLGKGWSIGGTSRIERCRASHEAGDFIAGGVARPIAFDDGDRFCLDGQRLLDAPANAAPCRAFAGMAARGLRTEVETFRRVCAYTPAGTRSGPAFFTVESRDGTLGWYGDRDADAGPNRPDGYVRTSAPGYEASALAWARTRLQDASGNHVDYYHSVNPEGGVDAEHLLQEVRYTGKLPMPGHTLVAPPFASLRFEYERLSVSSFQRRFVAGGSIARTRRLVSVIACSQATSMCAPSDQVRAYRLAYAPSPSGSGIDMLTQVEECADATGAICLAPTRFTTSDARHELAASQAWHPAGFGSAAKFEGFKLGDIDGDGRPDLVWLKDGASGDACPTEHVMVSFGERDKSGRQGFAPGVPAGCTPMELSAIGDSGWQLFDYTGDGRDDLFIAAATRWRLHPALGRGTAPIDMARDLLAHAEVPVLAHSPNATPPLLVDFDGNGLLDVLYHRFDQGLRARLMERDAQGWRWGSERVAGFAADSKPPCPDPLVPCSTGLPQLRHPESLRLLDVDGDAASDVLFDIRQAWREDPCEIGPRIPPDGCGTRSFRDVRFAYRVSAIGPGQITLTRVGDPLLPDHDAAKRVLAGDLNADGLTDLVYEAVTPGHWRYALNTGQGYLPPVSIGPLPRPASVRLVDLDGDARSDLAFVDVRSDGTFRYRMRRALAGGGFAGDTDIPGGGAFACIGAPCNPDHWMQAFADLDADGGIDYFALQLAEQATLVTSQPRDGARGRPRDVLVGIRNGLGAQVDIAYATLANAGVHRRGTGSREGVQSGRGSPVADVAGNAPVVARVASSAPQAGAPAAMAVVDYRYAGAKLQAGGRGFLGFASVASIDANGSEVVGVRTHYHQAFPFTGHAAATETHTWPAATHKAEACIVHPVDNACYEAADTPWPTRGVLATRTTHAWEGGESGTATGSRAFAPGRQVPVHVHTTGTRVAHHDPHTGALLRRSETTLVHDAHGNTIEARLAHFEGASASPMATRTVRSTYADDPARWQLGRLATTTVTHARPGEADVVRATHHAHDASGLPIQETLEPGTAWELRRQTVRDDRGNIVGTRACGGGAACVDPVDFHPTNSSAVQRATRVAFDPQGRYPVSTHGWFRDAEGVGVERPTSRVMARDKRGQASHVVDAHGVETVLHHGALGRAFHAWVRSVPTGASGADLAGVDAFTTMRRCGPGADEVACPSGARHRSRRTAEGVPTRWTYFDVLERPVLALQASAHASVAGKDVTAACTWHDARGRIVASSAPSFLSVVAADVDRADLETACDPGTGHWSTTQYDAFGQPLRIVAPDGATVRIDRLGLSTTTTDARGNATTEVRNASGEVQAIVDAGRHLQTFHYAADGMLTSVARDAGRGPVIHAWTYDALRRKRSQADPDSGATWFDYNALGEVVAQTDAAGHRIEHARDGQGRVYRKRVVAADGTVESEARYDYDSASNGVGLLHRATIAGRYLAWTAQSDAALDHVREWRYDALGRSVEVEIAIDGARWTESTVHDALGRAWKYRDASGRWRKDVFDARGHALASCDSTGTDDTTDCATPYRRVLEHDAAGRVTRERLGTDGTVTLMRAFDPATGRLIQVCATRSGEIACGLLDERYDFDAGGNLASRRTPAYVETFAYDALDRLTQSHAVGVGIDARQHFAYDALGNLCQAEMAGSRRDYRYAGRAGCGLDGAPGDGTDQWHGASQVTRAGAATFTYDARGNQVARVGGEARRITYSLDDRAHEIQLGPSGTPVQRTRLWYDADGLRYKLDEGARRWIRVGSTEVVRTGGSVVFHRHVAPGVVLQSTPSGQTEMLLLSDRLGSAVRVLDRQGRAIGARDWFAYGEPRRHDDPGRRDTAPLHADALRGFTGHAHVGYTHATQVVHANGRLYDPWLARFLQPDPLVATPADSAGWNAYAYAANNPLAWTDPTGLWGQREQDALRGAIALAITWWTGGAATSALMAGNVGTAFSVAMAGGFAAGMVASNGAWRAGVAGAFGAGLTMGLTVSGVGGTTAWALQSVGGGAIEALQGGSFGHGFVAAGLGGLLMPQVARIDHALLRGITGALVGGGISEATGGRFANGALGAGLQAALAGVEPRFDDIPSDDARFLQFANDSYGPHHDGRIDTVSASNGFSMALYRDGEAVVAAMRGSEGGMVRGGDWWGTNYPQALGVRRAQYGTAVEVARVLHAMHGDNLVFTGHSLGGGLASVAALATGQRAVTFNAAGVNPMTLSRLGLRDAAKHAGALVRSYRSASDILSLLQAASPLPNALGQPIWFAPAGAHGVGALCRNVAGSGC